MGWLDRVKQSMERVAEEAGDAASVGRLRIEIRTLNGRLEQAFEAIGAKVYDLYESGMTFPSEVAVLCSDADKVADEIKAKEAEIENIKAAV